jgi:hypothetical protein
MVAMRVRRARIGEHAVPPRFARFGIVLRPRAGLAAQRAERGEQPLRRIARMHALDVVGEEPTSPRVKGHGAIARRRVRRVYSSEVAGGRFNSLGA